MITTPGPVAAGPTSSILTSWTRAWLNLFKTRVMLVIVPFLPATVICEGYGVAVPEDGMEIGDGLLNLAAPGGGGLTVNRKLVLALFVPSLTVIVMVDVPLARPNAGVTVKNRFVPALPKKIFSLGTTFVSEDVPLNCRLSAGVSASLTASW